MISSVLNRNNLNKYKMNRKDFEILMNSLFSNNQLFIPQGQTIEEWIDNAFINEEKAAINYTRCSTLLLCVDTIWADLTKDLKYEMLEESHSLYLIKNDIGKNEWINKDWFKKQ
mgnify:CR=1 FL=1